MSEKYVEVREEDSSNPEKGENLGCSAWCTNYMNEYKALGTASYGLWMIYALKFMESYAHFALSYIETLILSEEFGYSDSEASWIYGIHGMLHFVYSLIFGFMIDNIGIKWSLIIGNVMMIIARFVLVFTKDKITALAMLYTLLPMGAALGIPVMSIAVRRYTNEQNRRIAFDVFYICMNLSAAVAAPAIDGVRLLYIPASENALSPYRVLILIGAIFTVLSFILCLFLPDAQVSKEDKPSSTPCTIVAEVVPKPKFQRFFILILLFVGLRMTFRHLDATFPKYMVREFGEEVLFGTIIGLQPLIIIIGLALVAPLLVSFDTFLLISIGAFFTGASPFVLTIVERSYWTTVAFVVVLSVGEILWAPRLYEYANNIADHGREGTYTALANMPMFAAALFTGKISGWLLTDYCPSYGNCNGRMVWFVIGCFSLASPILITILRPWIYNPEDLEGFDKKRKLESEEAPIKGIEVVKKVE